MQDDSEKLLKQLHDAEQEVTALRTELRKALEEAKRTRAEMHQFIEHLSHMTATTPTPPANGTKSPADAAIPAAPDALTTLLAVDARPYVLHIEDSAASFQLVQQIFEDMPKINLHRADCGRAGLSAVQARIPQLILLDLDLPDIHGSEVLLTLQKEPATARIPVIVISADATPSRIERMLAAGARNYLTKPFDIPRLLIMVEKILGDAVSGNGAAAWTPTVA
jgi:CheY-like chemotaxis protein